MLWMFIPIEFVSPAPPWVCWEAWSEAWVWRVWLLQSRLLRIRLTGWVLTLRVRTRMTRDSDLHCVHFLRPRVSIHHRRRQRKGVNCKPFHANVQTYFLHTDRDHSWDRLNTQSVQVTNPLKSEGEQISIGVQLLFLSLPSPAGHSKSSPPALFSTIHWSWAEDYSKQGEAGRTNTTVTTTGCKLRWSANISQWSCLEFQAHQIM